MTNSKNRLETHIYEDLLVVHSYPYKSSKYLLKFILCLVSLALFIIICIYRDKIFFGNQSTIISVFILIFLGGTLIMYILNVLPLLPSVVKNSFFKNMFFYEKLIIENGTLKYKNNFGKDFSWHLDYIESIYFEFNKPVGEFSGVPFLMPNYKAVIKVKNYNDSHYKEIMHSIKLEEIQEVYDAITNYCLKSGHYFREYKIEHKDKVRDFMRRGIEIQFVPIYKYYEMNKHKFSKEERDIFDDRIDNLSIEEGELKSAIEAKLRDIISLAQQQH